MLFLTSTGFVLVPYLIQYLSHNPASQAQQELQDSDSLHTLHGILFVPAPNGVTSVGSKLLSQMTQFIQASHLKLCISMFAGVCKV